ncbi:MAG: hypothetical protein GC164_03900 [Phycisphaera sp.]|nr:hypothetical protein [Phycisphaera sp.]
MGRRKQPDVRVRIVREGGLSSITRSLDWTRAQTEIDTDAQGDDAGKVGTWRITLSAVPSGGPYRLETSVGSEEDTDTWRRGGDAVHFFCVGDVWLIAGQSNAAGTARSPIDDPPEFGIHQYDDRRGWQIAVFRTLHNPWLAFAKTIKREMGHPVGLIPTAVGGSPISQWDPGQKGDLYHAMLKRVQASGTNIKGILWYQGESDTGPENHPHYKERFTRYVQGVREAVAQPQLPIITVQLNRHLNASAGADWDAIREYQRQLTHELDRVYIISAFESVLSDGIHNGSVGNLLIARRAADTAMGAVYGRDVVFRHPECSRAVSTDGKSIDLHFDHVHAQLDYHGGPTSEFPFVVRDEQGGVPVKGYAIPGRDVFRIELTRPLVGRSTVIGAAGACPPHRVPWDYHNHRAMLGFTRQVQPD